MEHVTFDRDTYISRRRELKKLIGKGRILLLGNNNSPMNYKDNYYPFRQDSTFLYYFGLDIPGLVGIMDVDSDVDIIYGNEVSIDDIIWTGSIPTLESLAQKVGIDRVEPLSFVIKKVNADIHFLPPYRGSQAILLAQLTGKKAHKIENRASMSLIKAIVSQREIKSQEEIDEINRAVTISDEMHLAVMKSARAGMKEYELVSKAAEVAYNHNVMFSFTPIMTTRGQVLHNHFYGNTIQYGDMILFDGGCESPSHYAGDITRTFPVSSTFSDRQRVIYDIVYSAQQNAINMCRPGTLFKDVHYEASRTIVEGMKSLGIVKGDIHAAIENGVHTMFFQCGLGHMMGLDVHDMENLGEPNVGYTNDLVKSTEFGWKSLRLGKALQEGFVITVEPGIYFIPQLVELCKSQNMYKDFINYTELDKWSDFGGIRLEDDFVIRKSGAQLLGIDMPRTSAEVEAIRSSF